MAYYENIAGYYDLLMRAGYYEHTELARTIQEVMGTRRSVLELGVGTGLLAHEILALDPTYDFVGVDFSAAMLDIARSRLGGAIDIIECDISELQLEREFDVALSCGGVWVIVRDGEELQLGTHLFDREKDVLGLSRVSEHLAPGGLLILSVHPPHEDREVHLNDCIIYSQTIGTGQGSREHFSLEKRYTFSRGDITLASEVMTLGFYGQKLFMRMLDDVSIRPLGFSGDERFFLFEKVARVGEPMQSRRGIEVGTAVKRDYQGYADTLSVLEASQLETVPYVTTLLGEEIIVHPNVYSPKYFTDTERFADNLPVREGDEMLEIGAGTGAISIIAAKRGAKKIVAVDINSHAVENTWANVRRHGLEERVDVRYGDVFSSIREDEQFDVIFWNTPFELVEEEVSDIEKSVGDYEYRATERFMSGARKHLADRGRLYIGFSSTLGRIDLLQQFARNSDFELKLVYEVELGGTRPYKLEIFEAQEQRNVVESQVMSDKRERGGSIARV